MTIDTISGLISAARDVPYQIVQQLNISLIDLMEIFVISVILDCLLKRYNARLKNREPGHVYDFWADGETRATRTLPTVSGMQQGHSCPDPQQELSQKNSIEAH